MQTEEKNSKKNTSLVFVHIFFYTFFMDLFESGRRYRVDENGKKVFTVIPGDGVGPECIEAALRILEATGAPVRCEFGEAGAKVFKMGIESGVTPATLESIKRNRVVLKGPLETPVGYGEKSANVTLRKLFETYANVRPIREFPNVETPYSGRGIDFVIIRENVEDLYAAIEHMQTPEVAQALKIITREGSERVVRFAFELARAEGRKKVHCATKANILKFTEGMMKRVFEEVAKEYPDIESHHIIIDNCAHQLVRRPEQFDVIVTTNMNGDIISDLGSALVGGLGFAPSANIGEQFAIFEAVHGTAPKYAGRNVINPTAVILSMVMMLRYLDELEFADIIENALLYTLEEGKLTGDLVGYDKGMKTTEYTNAIISNLGKKPKTVKPRTYRPMRIPQVPPRKDSVVKKTVGVDVFIETKLKPSELASLLESILVGIPFKLKMISSKGTIVYPSSEAVVTPVGHYWCRFVAQNGTGGIDDSQIILLLQKLSSDARLVWNHLEKLYEFDNVPAFSKAHGEN